MNINSMSKLELEAYAREKYDVELDRRLSKTKLLKEVAALDNAYHVPEAAAPKEVVVEKVVEKIVEVPVPTKAKESGDSAKMLAKVIKAYEAWIGSNRDRNTYRVFAETIIEAKKLI